MISKLNETAFEKHIAEYLAKSPLYVQRTPKDFDIERLVDPCMFMDFLKAQTDTWRRLVRNFGNEADALEAAIAEYNRQLRRGSSFLKLLREGFTLQGVSIKLLQFKPDMNLNDENQRLYEANRFAVVRQMHYSTGDDKGKELDLCILVNGFPLITFELKNEGTGQNIAHGMHQYRTDRDKTNKMLRTCLVHFAMDTNSVMMTTKLNGDNTFFLPFNKETQNPVVEGDYATCYMWKEVLQADSLLNIIQNFIKQFRNRPTAPWNTIFPRYHQLRCVRNIITDLKEKGVGTNYLVQHSAGSGKTNSMAWLAHQLANLQHADNTPVFDSVIMVTDRIVLDRNIADAIKAFETVPGTVKDIRHGSKNLAKALEDGGKIIVSTVQKFAFAQEHLSKLAGQHFAVIIDEAHTAMGNEAAKDIRVTLSSEEQLRSVVEEADPEIHNDVDRMYSEMQVARRMMKHISYFAFTATPKERTFALFGTKKGNKTYAFDIYEMKQAIEEGFIKDVLLNYTTFQTMFELVSGVSEEEMKELYDKTGALRVAMQYVAQNPYAINYKADMMLTYFMQNTLHKMQNQAKAMVVTSSRLDAVRYKKALDKIIHDKYNDRIKTLVAFSGTVEMDGHSYTEENMNGYGIKDNGIKVKFEEPDEKLLIVAEKFQTGFDQPLLHTMFVDKKLGGIQCVQTLSRLNRCHPDKEDTMIFDFVNTFDDIKGAFEPYYQTTLLDGKIDTQKLYDFKDEIDAYGCFSPDQVEEVARILADPAVEPSVLSPLMRKIVDDKVKTYTEEEQGKYRRLVNRYIRQYGFIAQIMCFLDPALEKYYVFLKLLYKFLPYTKETLPLDLLNKIDLSKFRVQLRETGAITLEEADGIIKPTQPGTPTEQGDPEQISLKDLLAGINEPYAGFLDENDKLLTHLLELLKKDPEVIQAFSAHNTMDMIIQTLKTRFKANAFIEVGKYMNLLKTMENDQMFTNQFYEMTMQMMSEYLSKGKLPEYNRDLLIQTLIDKFADRLSYVCELYDVDFDTAVQMTVLIMQSAQNQKIAGLKMLPKYMDHIYRGELLDVQKQMYYGHFVTKFEAFLKLLYSFRKGSDIPSTVIGLSEISTYFREIVDLKNTHDMNLSDLKDYYHKIFVGKKDLTRNTLSHNAPEVPESELQSYIDAALCIYFYTVIVSLKDINRRMENAQATASQRSIPYEVPEEDYTYMMAAEPDPED